MLTFDLIRRGRVVGQVIAASSTEAVATGYYGADAALEAAYVPRGYAGDRFEEDAITEHETRLRGSFRRLGLSEAAATHALAGRDRARLTGLDRSRGVMARASETVELRGAARVAGRPPYVPGKPVESRDMGTGETVELREVTRLEAALGRAFRLTEAEAKIAAAGRER